MDFAFRCLTSIGLRDTILSKFAFEPPSTCNYTILPGEEGALRMQTLSDPKDDKSEKVSADSFLSSTPEITLSVHEVGAGTKTHTNLLYLKNAKNTSGCTIVYCHGNSSCLGRLYPYLVNICKFSEVNIIGVEYPGYGTIKGNPTDVGVISNVIEAYKYITKVLKLNPWSLIFYGQSLGTGPATFLAAHPAYPIGGLIIEGAFVSGLHLFNKSVFLMTKYDRELIFITRTSSLLHTIWDM